jgi:N-acetylneuraminic acid mutarotase
MGSFNNVVFVQPRIERNISFSGLRWLKKPVPGTPEIYGHSFSHIGKYFYIYGGIVGGKFSNNLYKLDSTASELSIVSCDGEQRAYHACAEYGGKLLFYAGVNWNKYLPDYGTYNIASNTWNSTVIWGEAAPPAMEKFTCCMKGSSLIIFGGYYCHGDLEYEGNYNDVFILNLEIMEWQRPAIAGDRPEKRCSHTASIVGETMFVFGGVKMATAPTFFNDLWALDLDKSEWHLVEAKGKGPCPRSGHSMQPIGHFLCIFGGKGRDAVYNDVFLFDTRSLKWHKPDTIGDAPKPRYEHASGKLGASEIVIFGGRSRQPANHIYYLSLE